MTPEELELLKLAIEMAGNPKIQANISDEGADKALARVSRFYTGLHRLVFTTRDGR